MKLRSKAILCFALSLATSLLTFGVHASEPTAFQLIKEANKHVGEEVKDKVAQIRSEKSVGGLVPSVWYVVFYDSDAALKATEVKLGGGKKLDVSRPFRIIERATGYRAMERSKLKVDSDEALKIAQKETLLAKLKLTNSQMTLEKWEDVPVWKVRLWAEKSREPSKVVDIGEIFISAEEGKVLRRDLHIDRID